MTLTEVALVATNSKHTRSATVYTHGNVQPSNEQIAQLRSAEASEIWLTDSGASAHMTSCKEWFCEYRPRRDSSTVTLDDDDECTVVGEGTIAVERLVDGE